ncbi:MAG: hypothetical protein JOZ19_04710 [Rubrobacter sp.]|nr:hypothetical protein [Rubrobacter sp.]
MGAKRAKDLLAAFLVGHGVLDLIAPRQRAMLWVFGPEPLRKSVVWLAEHPAQRRAHAALRIGIGLWLAQRQYRED